MYGSAGQTPEQITIDLDRDNFMSAQDALKYGTLSDRRRDTLCCIYVCIYVCMYVCMY